ncbi:hypothetical protein SGFS_066200 [Streptomyces graminofaciens]|uniref:Transposase n=1 Tax=Streptomyces graminofaciens TaxID=68212 RepID=A0ABM7FGI3_9ACTN|nr:hypothetical protein SGFS_066200 [Streptomyces graminofaciens]
MREQFVLVRQQLVLWRGLLLRFEQLTRRRGRGGRPIANPWARREGSVVRWAPPPIRTPGPTGV